jgi:hypothetical protein
MVSNHGVYRAHEFIYNDYVYDDHGANTDGLDRQDLPFGGWPNPSHPTDTRLAPTGGSVRYAGDFMYPSPDNAHIANVADLIEFRAAADGDDLFYRFVLGDMTAPDSTVVGVCIDEDRNNTTGVQSWPAGANLSARLGCEHLLTVFGTGALVTDTAGTVDLDSLSGSVLADVANATIDVRVPKAVADPAGSTWRFTVAAGMWDAAANSWAAPLPIPQNVGAPVATGGSPLAPNLWDLLSNNDEPNSYWDEEKQANDLARSDLIGDHVDIDFARLASGGDDPDTHLTGVLERIYQSVHPMDEPSRGLDIDRGLGQNFVYRGQYQPYALVVPSYYYDTPKPGGWPFDLCLHPLNGNHNVEVYYGDAFAHDLYTPVTTGTLPQTGYLGFTQIEEQIDRLGGVYACVLGRGEGVGYTGGDGLVDVLEVQRDVAAHYAVDDSRVTVHGVSLGAIGSWYVSEHYPDRYAAAMPYIFTPGITDTGGNPNFANLYNVPVTFAIGTLDEFAQGTQGDMVADQLTTAGDEFLYAHYLGRQHEGRIELDFLPFNEALQYGRQRDPDPARVRFRFDPTEYSLKEPGCGCAYWVSGLTPRGEGAAGQIDVTSNALAAKLPGKQVVVDGLYLNTIEGFVTRFRGLFRMSAADFTAMWHPEQWQPGWKQLNLSVTETVLSVPAAGNGFSLTATDLDTATLDTARMGLDTSSTIDSIVTGNGVTTLTLLGTFSNSAFVLLDGAPVAVTHTPTGITVTLDLSAPGEHSLRVE